LILVSRSGASTAEAIYAIKRISKLNIEVHVKIADVSREDHVKELMQFVKSLDKPLGGEMIHL
jgi:hypothetical protein